MKKPTQSNNNHLSLKNEISMNILNKRNSNDLDERDFEKSNVHKHLSNSILIKNIENINEISNKEINSNLCLEVKEIEEKSTRKKNFVSKSTINPQLLKNSLKSNHKFSYNALENDNLKKSTTIKNNFIKSINDQENERYEFKSNLKTTKLVQTNLNKANAESNYINFFYTEFIRKNTMAFSNGNNTVNLKIKDNYSNEDNDVSKQRINNNNSFKSNFNLVNEIHDLRESEIEANKEKDSAYKLFNLSTSDSYFAFLISEYVLCKNNYRLQYLMVNGITSFNYYVSNTLEKNIKDYKNDDNKPIS